MSRSPIEMMLDGVQWVQAERPDTDDGLPYATHTGLFDIAGLRFQCARLSNGQAVFYGEEFDSWLKAAQSAAASHKPSTAAINEAIKLARVAFRPD